MPATHAQAPALQLRSVPQEVPSGWFPVSVQTAAPVPQAIAAVWQTLDDVQAVPAAQATQAPVGSQTRFEPQAVPAATWLCTQLAPVIGSQATAPVWQASEGGQALPATQAHAPFSHMR